MKLLIDVGNTCSKFVTCQQDKLSPIDIVESNQISQQWLETNFPSVEHCLVSNVSNDQLNAIFLAWFEKQKIHYHFIQSETEKFNVVCAYDNPNTFGVDRWLALLGAAKLLPNQASLIVDLGTATTIDLLSSSGQHRGGWILPGIDLMFSSVVNNTNKVFANPEKVEQINFASNTSEAVNQAIWAATIGYISTAITCARNNYLEAEETLTLILTGGNAKQLSQLVTFEYELVENLVFIGMNRYNANKSD